MDILKVKFKLNGLEFELEGREDVVKDELNSFKDFVMGNLINRLGVISLNNNTPISKPQDAEIIDSDFPQLREIVIKDIPKTEVEWILVYSFYASKFGAEPFKESDIRDFYESSKRKNSSRMKNFSANFNKVISNGYIKILNEEEYITVKKGIEHVKEILSGSFATDTSLPEQRDNKTVKKSKKVKGKTSSSGLSLSLVSHLNLNPQSDKSLKEYFGEFITKSFFERNLLFIYYLEKVLKLDGIGLNHIYTCYKNVGEKVPGNLYQSIVDTKNSKGWIESKDINNLKTTIQGENFVEHDFQKI